MKLPKQKPVRVRSIKLVATVSIWQLQLGNLERTEINVAHRKELTVAAARCVPIPVGCCCCGTYATVPPEH